MQPELFVGQSSIQTGHGEPRGEFIKMLADEYYCIRNYDRMPPFFMSIVSSSDHWMFISSSAGLSAGRANADSALFPYYTDDRITENQPNTGPVSIFRIQRKGRTSLWEPFSSRHTGVYRLERNLYKNVSGNKLIFEEINHDLQLTYRTIWRTSDRFGFVKTSILKNDAQASSAVVDLLDGLQNILPYGANTILQNTFSNLLNAYKRSELEPQTGLGIFTLSATLTDLAEPSESLKATLAWKIGLENVCYLLATHQLDNFRAGLDVTQETDICGFRGAYLVNTQFEIAPCAEKEWHIIADLNQDGSQVAALIQLLNQNPQELLTILQQDIDKSSASLLKIVAQADGLQFSSDRLSTAHHFANVMFNCMRGGIFADNYTIGIPDFLNFISVHNKTLPGKYPGFFANLPHQCNIVELLELAANSASPDLQRLCYEYLPLTFSRRHGDPSRPWNKFSINIKKPDGSQKLDYQGNWRDIFQNWEPLAYSYPEFTEGMLCKFLNAITADGYNPYRITRNGIEWETPMPDDPWANIGYWGDHQVIYLQKLLEISLRFHPGRLQGFLNRRIFSHANVPYRIKPYSDLVKDPYSTIMFDWQLEREIEARVQTLGSDGKLTFSRVENEQVLHVNLLEKLLIILLIKLANFVPEGGIWMNTQRPEWNDANNALVGKGLSVVTLGYLRRFIVLLSQFLAQTPDQEFQVTGEVATFYHASATILQNYTATLRAAASFSPGERSLFMDAFGQASSQYRSEYYANGFSTDFTTLEKEPLLAFLNLALEYAESSLRANLAGPLYHSYNTLSFQDGTATIGHLDEMLEGQVSILSSGLLSPAESLALLKNLKTSRLYRADQHSYILYPQHTLPGFLQKNNLDETQVTGSTLIAHLVADNDQTLISRDINGRYHFNGTFRNAADVKKTLLELSKSPNYQPLVDADSAAILDMFENAFNHKAFTGRSGRFFAYEGLGSIYWHMVSKLLLAVQEICLRAASTNEPQEITSALLEIYYDIRSGLGFNKAPQVYGAFPTDPYSHTPAGQGAKQPGMTGQVKEEIITRFAELGLYIENGQINFNSLFLRESELTTHPGEFSYMDVSGQQNLIELPAGSLAYTFCQTPIMIQRSTDPTAIQIFFANGSQQTVPGNTLRQNISHHIFTRDNHVRQITIHLNFI